MLQLQAMKRGGRGRVEVDGAGAARALLREHGVSGDALRGRVGRDRAPLTTVSPEHKVPEVGQATAASSTTYWLRRRIAERDQALAKRFRRPRA
jgi:hypothetical protein